MTLGGFGLLLKNRCFHASLTTLLEAAAKFWPRLGNTFQFRSLPFWGLKQF